VDDADRHAYPDPRQQVPHDGLPERDRSAVRTHHPDAPGLHGQRLPALGPEPDEVSPQREEAPDLQAGIAGARQRRRDRAQDQENGRGAEHHAKQ
jgi:hypothetical protein